MIDGHGFALWQVVGAPAEASTPEQPSKTELLRGALTGMGYRSAEAAAAVAALSARIETEPLADLVHEALRIRFGARRGGGCAACVRFLGSRGFATSTRHPRELRSFFL